MPMQDYDRYDGLELAALVRKGEVSAVELLDEAIARTERVNGAINAVVVKHYDYAREQIAKGLPEGPFKGVPFLLKDLSLLARTRTTFGSSLNRNFVAGHDNTLTQRYRDAGVTFFGKSASPELGLMPTTEPRLHGPCRNPWNVDHSAGGSSGGAAAAVAARILPLAHATDGGGSIRIPASTCGVFGLKPTRARTPYGPDRGAGWGGFTVGHVVSISVCDSAAMLDATQGAEATSPYVAPPPARAYLEEVALDPGCLRVAFCDRSPYGDLIDPEIAAAVRDTAHLLTSLGHHVEESKPKLPHDPATVISAIVGVHAAHTLRLAEETAGRILGEDDFEILTLASAAAGQNASGIDYVRSELAAFEIGRALAGFFASIDVFLSPTLCLPPVRIGEIDTMSRNLSGINPLLRRYMPWTSMFNMSGQPAMSMPLAWSKDGLPLGMMFAGRFGDEATLFRLAAQLEHARPWKDRRPPVCS
jgi:amidase